MKFSGIIEQASDLLQRQGRVSYRMLKIEFELSDDHLDALKEELIEVKELAIDKDGKMLIWVGDGETIPEETVAQTADAPAAALSASAPSPQPMRVPAHRNWIQCAPRHE